MEKDELKWEHVGSIKQKTHEREKAKPNAEDQYTDLNSFSEQSGARPPSKQGNFVGSSFNSPDGKSDTFSVPRSRADLQDEKIRQLEERVKELSQSQSTAAGTNREKGSMPSSLHDSVNSANGQLLNQIQTSLNDLNKAIEDPHKQCNITIGALKEQIEELKADNKDLKQQLKQKEAEWLDMFKDIYNISKKLDFHKELTQKLKSLQTSLNYSKRGSQEESSCSDMSQNAIVIEELKDIQKKAKGEEFEGSESEIQQAQNKF